MIVEEQRSGAASRPLLEQLLEQLQPGQTVLVYKVDRLARNLADLLRILARIRGRRRDLSQLDGADRHVDADR